MTEAIKWPLIQGMEKPCADISYAWHSHEGATLALTLHFSRVLGGMNADLRVLFADAMYLAWEDESLGLIDLPDQLPYCRDPDFADWVFPSLKLKDSALAKRYADKAFDADETQHSQVNHFVFVSMNDLVHVVAVGEPEFETINITS